MNKGDALFVTSPITFNPFAFAYRFDDPLQDILVRSDRIGRSTSTAAEACIAAQKDQSCDGFFSDWNLGQTRFFTGPDHPEPRCSGSQCGCIAEAHEEARGLGKSLPNSPVDLEGEMCSLCQATDLLTFCITTNTINTPRNSRSYFSQEFAVPGDGIEVNWYIILVCGGLAFSILAASVLQAVLRRIFRGDPGSAYWRWLIGRDEVGVLEDEEVRWRWENEEDGTLPLRSTARDHLRQI